MAPEVIDLVSSDDETPVAPKYVAQPAPVASTSASAGPSRAVSASAGPSRAEMEAGPSRAEMEAERLARIRKREANGEGLPASKRAKVTASYTSDVPMDFVGGAIRICKTDGRGSDPHAVGVTDLIKTDDLVSCALFAFFWADDLIFEHIPVGSRQRAGVRCLIGRDIGQDHLLEPTMQRLKVTPSNAVGHPDAADRAKVEAEMIKAHAMEHPGSETWFAPPLPKVSWRPEAQIVWILEYRSFLRVVISSANSMSQDLAHSDNQFYIHDFPRLLEGGQTLSGAPAERPTSPLGEAFGHTLMKHLKQLGLPADYRKSIRLDKFDLSSVKIRLVPSMPGQHSGSSADEYGFQRLSGSIASSLTSAGLRKLACEYWSTIKDGMVGSIEICTATLGFLDDQKLIRAVKEACNGAPGGPSIDLTIVYPSMEQVDTLHRKNDLVLAIPFASQTTCVTKLDGAEYESKDYGVLMHMKHIMCWRQGAPIHDRPDFILLGSSNLSQAAFGNINGTNTVLNAELGVFVTGDVLPSLLKPGASWGSIVPYKRERLEPYGREDRPWSWGAWSQEHPEEAARATQQHVARR